MLLAESTAPNATATTQPPATATRSAAEVPDGYGLFDGSADGFLIALPSRWVPLDFAEGDAETLIAEAEGVLEPEAMEVVRGALAADIAPSFYALDVTGDPNVNLVIVPLSPTDTLENLEELLPKHLGELFGARILSVDRVEFGGVEGLRVTYEVDFGEGLAEQHQYHMLTEDTDYVVTFTSFDPEADRETFAQVMETFTLVAE